jgi:hypothetical protein
MQPGDLVKLVERDTGSVVVRLEDRAPTTRILPEGTVAVFLGCLGEADCGNPYILIEGRVGWVWAEELEAL